MIDDISEDEHLSSRSLNSKDEQAELVEIDAQCDGGYYKAIEQKIRTFSYKAFSYKDILHQEELAAKDEYNNYKLSKVKSNVIKDIAESVIPSLRQSVDRIKSYKAATGTIVEVDTDNFLK